MRVPTSGLLHQVTGVESACQLFQHCHHGDTCHYSDVFFLFALFLLFANTVLCSCGHYSWTLIIVMVGVLLLFSVASIPVSSSWILIYFAFGIAILQSQLLLLFFLSVATILIIAILIVDSS